MDVIHILERTAALTELDSRHKTSAEIFLSLSEEVGELAREIKIEDKLFGNAHKTPSVDKSVGEAVDVVVMALAVYFDRWSREFGFHPMVATAQLLDRVNKKLDKWNASQQVQFKDEHDGET